MIRPDALARLLTDHDDGPARPVVLDVRWRVGGPPARPDHEAGHVPGAVFLDLDTALADPPGAGGRHPLPDPDRLRGTLAQAGAGAGSAVLAYDDADGAVAARAWWSLRWLGWPADRVRVLDGGWAAWRAGGHPVTAEPSRPRPAHPVAATPAAMPVLDADGAARVAGGGVLLDARAPARYRGDTEPIDARAGHVPGARNAPFAE
ncbi:MAG TPA: rhodanese-like domain-containing protein, partial [Pseudonocardia sp.]